MISPENQSFFNTSPSSSLLIFLGGKTSVAEGLAVRYLPRLYNDPFPAVTSASNFYVFGNTAERPRGGIFIYRMILTAGTVWFVCLFPQLFNDRAHFSRQTDVAARFCFVTDQHAACVQDCSKK